ncbi:hypothetical protein [Terricaulis silvestris]|uniref:Secreted protein n=1 Tax=Terricaulis silvestris TaxID=2686094 RepID=A0A6I6MPP9_9CAUL|nr:hypothetical protein [Terricaulis silvestris]QGZ95358.1 hypothetical protein DSM104635_02207 [Terricaulis silvestris]
MQVATALALLACAVFVACATPPQVSEHDRSCAVLASVAATRSTTPWPQLNGRDEEKVQAIPTTRIADTGYACGNTMHLETGRGPAVFFDIGLSADQRYASLGMGSADHGERCLLQRRQDDWTVIGCMMLWVA